MRTFKQEPIVYVSVAIAILMFVRDVMVGTVTLESLDAALVVVGGLLGREFVSPVAAKAKRAEG